MAAAEQLFADQGYHGARLREIAAAVGIQKASLFHHFPGKEQLYRAVLQLSAEETGTALENALAADGPFQDRLRLLVSAYVDLVAQRPTRTRMFLRQYLDRSQVSTAGHLEFGPLFSRIVDFVREGQRASVFRALDPALLVLSVVGLAAFFFTAASLVAPLWGAETTARSDFAAAVKGHVIEMVERMLVLRADDRPVGPKACSA